jgi:hypothetical protein
MFVGTITNAYLPVTGVEHKKDWYQGEAACTLLLSLKHLTNPVELQAFPLANELFPTHISKLFALQAQQSAGLAHSLPALTDRKD